MSLSTPVPELTYGPITERVNVGIIVGHQAENTIDILFMEDGEVRFSHVCRLARSGHIVVTRQPLTIVASILCSDCGIHGFVTDGTWRPA
jgi:hypothetical protein